MEHPDNYPVSAKRHTFEHLRDASPISALAPIPSARDARVRDCLSLAVHRFFHEHGFLRVHTPIITTSDAEGAGAMFWVSTLDLANLPRNDQGEVDFTADFFGKAASLTVSGQLNVEAYCLALSRGYTFGPTFRAENSNTTRHLAEFWMIGFRDRLREPLRRRRPGRSVPQVSLSGRAQRAIRRHGFFAQHVDKDCITRVESFVAASFERMEYTERDQDPRTAQAKGEKFEFPVRWGIDLQSEHETLSDRDARGPTRRFDELPQGYQSLLYAAE